MSCLTLPMITWRSKREYEDISLAMRVPASPRLRASANLVHTSLMWSISGPGVCVCIRAPPWLQGAAG